MVFVYLNPLFYIHEFLILQKLSCDRPSSDGEPNHENGISDGKDPGRTQYINKCPSSRVMYNVQKKKPFIYFMQFCSYTEDYGFAGL